MYEFNYQHLVPGGPAIVCIVPTQWLRRALPTFGGQVHYVDNHASIPDSPDYLFEFSEGASRGSSPSVLLTIYQPTLNNESGFVSLSEQPTRILCGMPSAMNMPERETYLLNHIFGCLALSASVGNNYVDFQEVVTWIAVCRELEFAFACGSAPDKILPRLRGYFPDDGSDRTFAMLYCREDNMHLDYLSALAKRFSQGGPSILCDAAVNAEQMLVSVLADMPKR